MKKLTLFFLLICTTSLIGQDSRPRQVGDVKELTKKEKKQIEKEKKKAAKRLEKEDKAKAKAAEEERDILLNQRNVDFGQLMTFPGNYLKRPLRLKQVMLGEIRPYTENGVTLYFVEVQQSGIISFPFPNPSKVAFVMDDLNAQQSFTHYQTHRAAFGDYFPAHLSFELFQLILENGHEGKI